MVCAEGLAKIVDSSSPSHGCQSGGGEGGEGDGNRHLITMQPTGGGDSWHTLGFIVLGY